MSLYKAEQAAPTSAEEQAAANIRKVVTSLSDVIATSCVRLHHEMEHSFADQAALEATLGVEDAIALKKFCDRLRCALKLVHPPLSNRILREKKEARERAKAAAQPAA